MARNAQRALPGHLQSQIAPLLAVMLQLNQQIFFLDEVLARGAQQHEAVARLCTAPGVGPVVATAFVATLDKPERFRGAHQVESFLGLVPQERSSGEKQHRGPITKSGNGRMRWLLVQAAWAILRSQSQQTVPLREWAGRLAQRRGKNVAVVALARRLAGILFAMWRDGKDYEVKKLQAEQDSALPAAA